ncbi:Uncharacterised protein [Vibrio cholerae]|nr:Uncharacterised protein [Vibrio cholerae]CSC53813.1 Uncharacterised protein [Vibrio cholerae]CSD57283.1 Uncharacterised protein [Vibrio cholerae]CSI52841.1 Uncharacterised protein [Vibrio cholerae]
MTTAFQSEDLIVSHVSNQCCSLWVLTEEVLTNVSAIFRFERLVVAVDGFVHQLQQFTCGIFRQ